MPQNWQAEQPRVCGVAKIFFEISNKFLRGGKYYEEGQKSRLYF
jgi:hypothetical protein